MGVLEAVGSTGFVSYAQGFVSTMWQALVDLQVRLRT